MKKALILFLLSPLIFVVSAYFTLRMDCEGIIQRPAINLITGYTLDSASLAKCQTLPNGPAIFIGIILLILNIRNFKMALTGKKNTNKI